MMKVVGDLHHDDAEGQYPKGNEEEGEINDCQHCCVPLLISSIHHSLILCTGQPLSLGDTLVDERRHSVYFSNNEPTREMPLFP
jgi:hypothetical protein